MHTSRRREKEASAIVDVPLQNGSGGKGEMASNLAGHLEKMRKTESHLLAEALVHVRDMEYQMGGQHKNPNLGMMRSECGLYVLKPVKEASDYKTAPSKYKQATVDELSFYEMVFRDMVAHPNHADLVSLRSFMPSFLGHTAVSRNGQDVRCIILRDETRGLAAPCLLDLKMGCQHYFEGEAARQQSKAKYLSKDDLGFCITGMQVCDPTSGQVTVSIRPKTATHLDSSEVLQYMDKFLQKDHPGSSLLRKQILEKVLDVLTWFQRQRSFLFLRSSLFVAYDAFQLTKSLQVVKDGSTRNTNEEELPDKEQGNKYPVVSNVHIEASPKWANAHEKLQSISSSLVESVDQQEQPNANSPSSLNSHCQVSPAGSQAPSSGPHLGMSQEGGSGNGPTKEVDSCSTLTSSQQPNTVSWLPQEYQLRKLAAAVATTSVESAMEVRLCMIDFAHVYQSQGACDENYLFGLQQLITYLRRK